MANARKIEGSTSKTTGQNAKRPIVLSLSKYLAYPSITHAGGQYLADHISALETFATVLQIAPNTPLNSEAAAKGIHDSDSQLLPEGWPKLRGFWFRLCQIESVLAGSAIYLPVRKLFRDNRAPWAELARADIVELQWSEMIALAPAIRKKFPEKSLVGIAHDVITQRWRREAATSPKRSRRILARFAGWLSAKREAQSFAALDMLIVFSEKDAELALNLAPEVRAEVVHPGLGPKPSKRLPSSAEPVALFVGAMSRPENSQSAIWFVEKIWPTVIAELPQARLIIAGANPDESLRRLASRSNRVELTGFVESLQAFYEHATVCVVPMLLGAGVKFKTVDAMLYGVPVVATSVGVEGIEAGGLFAAVTDDAEQFAAATVTALRSPNEKLANASKEWAERVYGRDTFVARIENLYGNLT